MKNFSRHQLWFWPVALAAAVYWASANVPVVPDMGFSFQDKIVHALFFGLQANLVQRALLRSSGRPLLAFLCAALFTSALGALDEWHQSFTPGRYSDVTDWIADSVGSALASTLYFTDALRYRRILEFKFSFRKKSRPPSDK